MKEKHMFSYFWWKCLLQPRPVCQAHTRTGNTTPLWPASDYAYVTAVGRSAASPFGGRGPSSSSCEMWKICENEFCCKVEPSTCKCAIKKEMPGGEKNLLMRLYKRHYYTNVGLLLFAEDLHSNVFTKRYTTLWKMC